jgi:hypothetical protein
MHANTKKKKKKNFGSSELINSPLLHFGSSEHDNNPPLMQLPQSLFFLSSP